MLSHIEAVILHELVNKAIGSPLISNKQKEILEIFDFKLKSHGSKIVITQEERCFLGEIFEICGLKSEAN